MPTDCEGMPRTGTYPMADLRRGAMAVLAGVWNLLGVAVAYDL